MKSFLIFFATLALLITSCSKEYNSNNNVRQFDFDFDFNNQYKIESTGELFETNKAYIDTNYATWQNSVLVVNNYIHLNDGEIGDSLVLGCWGSWDGYLKNPSTIIKICFPQRKLENGVYKYSRKKGFKDFDIQVKRNITWDNYLDPWGNVWPINCMTDSDNLAYTSRVNNNSEIVNHAEIKIKFINTLNIEILYIIETFGGDLIKGSYRGKLENFTLYTPEIDCD